MVPEEQMADGLPARLRRGLTRGAQFCRERAWPGIKRWLGAVYAIMRRRVMPAVGSGSVRIKGELVKIHRQQNWLQRCSTTLTGNAAGLGMAMLSTKVVEGLVEKRELSNMWGLFARHPVVSERTFEVLSFVVEFLLGLIVFTITEYYVGEYQRKREAGEAGVVASEGEGAL